MCLFSSGFNPHPANRPGDATCFTIAGRSVIVSIRTRLTGRVMHPEHVRPGKHHGVSIRTRLTGRVMLVGGIVGLYLVMFQSAPG